MTTPEPTARERLADAACEAAFHWHLDRENDSWRDLWYRVVDAIADAALQQAREEVLAPFRALADSYPLGSDVPVYRIRRAIAEAGGDE